MNDKPSTPSTSTTERGGRAARRVLDAVTAAGAHLSYEQIEGLVDARLDAGASAKAQAHLDQCAMCRSEVHDLRMHAQALRQPLALREAKGAGRFAWFTRAWPQLALASVVGAVALTVVLQGGGLGSGAGSGGRPESMQTPGGAPTDMKLDHSALSQLESLSPEAAAAWRARDHARLAALLLPLTERSQPLALMALASLYAQGLGVPQDWRRAEQLWQRAAALGQPGAKENLLTLRQRGV